VKTDELIVELARSAGPVRPLAAPLVRLARWAVAAVAVTAFGAMVFSRDDVWTAVHHPTFIGLAVMTLLTALLAAASAFVLSVPGAARSAWLRALPIIAGVMWMGRLAFLLAEGGDPAQRVTAFPIHAACVIEIAGLGILVGWPLFGMLRRAAPLHYAWSAALATLAATALGAAATQFICPIDDPAHQLVGHLLPVMLFSVAGAFAGRRSLDWMGTADARMR
jgi:hypothetical protein